MNLPEIVTHKTFSSYSVVGDALVDMDGKIGGIITERVAGGKSRC